MVEAGGADHVKNAVALWRQCELVVVADIFASVTARLATLHRLNVIALDLEAGLRRWVLAKHWLCVVDTHTSCTTGIVPAGGLRAACATALWPSMSFSGSMSVITAFVDRRADCVRCVFASLCEYSALCVWARS